MEILRERMQLHIHTFPLFLYYYASTINVFSSIFMSLFLLLFIIEKEYLVTEIKGVLIYCFGTLKLFFHSFFLVEKTSVLGY